VAALLASGSDTEGVADSAIHSLLPMGAGSEYDDEIARVLQTGGQAVGEPTETAAYALAVIGAKEHSADLATLLRKDFAMRFAAKALALMGRPSTRKALPRWSLMETSWPGKIARSR
jgi:hypothetical protein